MGSIKVPEEDRSQLAWDIYAVNADQHKHEGEFVVGEPEVIRGKINGGDSMADHKEVVHEGGRLIIRSAVRADTV